MRGLRGNGIRSARKAPNVPSGPGRKPGEEAACLRSEAPDWRGPRCPSPLSPGSLRLDRVTGGGFVRGSVLLVGGRSGIGKSTLLIQAAAALAQPVTARSTFSGEEAVAQVRLRAERLGLARRGGRACG